MAYEVEGHSARKDQRGPGERLCGKDCQAWKLNKEYVMDHSRRRKLTKDV